LTVDELGLKFESDLIDTQSNRDVYAMVKAGILSECSFGFTCSPIDGSEWKDLDTDKPLRRIMKIDRLFDVSIVDTPAYENTEVYARSFEALEDAKKTIEVVKSDDDIRKRIRIKIKLGGN
jgi:hypothetical protein